MVAGSFIMKATAIFALICAVSLTAFADTPKPLNVEAGKSFTISVESSQTTGHEWQFVKPLNNKLIKFLGVDYIKSDNEKVGAPGREIWRFQAVSEGKAEIQLKCSRPWQKSVPPIRTTNLVVVISIPKPPKETTQQDQKN
jgi:inhibitor of cysteine peptidase